MIAVNIFIALVTMKYVYLVYIHLSINNIVVMIKSGPIGAETVPSMGEVFSTACKPTPAKSQRPDMVPASFQECNMTTSLPKMNWSQSV